MMESGPHVLVAMPSIDGRVAFEAAATLLEWSRAGARLSLAGSIATERARARNALVSAFHAERSYTHLFLLDGDLVLPADSLARLLGHDRDAVAAPVPLAVPATGVPADAPAPTFDLGGAVGEEGVLYRHERASASALLLSRRAVEALVDDAKRAGRVYAAGPALAGTPGVCGTPVHYECFRAGAQDGAWRADDAEACATLRRAGMAIHVDATIVVRRRASIVG